MLRYVFLAVVAFSTSQVDAREIPISGIYSTVYQTSLRSTGIQSIGPGRRYVDDKLVEEDYAPAMDSILRQGGASNVFLVDAANIHDAVKATSRALNRAADRPTAWDKPAGSYWLVAYLGSGHSSPLKWRPDRITVDGNKIRLTYSGPPPPPAGKYHIHTTDVIRYYYWVPIGSLDDSAYCLELYDADLKEVTLMRRVQVKDR